MITKHPPLNRDYNRDPGIKARNGRGFIDHGSTVGCVPRCFASTVPSQLHVQLGGGQVLAFKLLAS